MPYRAVLLLLVAALAATAPFALAADRPSAVAREEAGDVDAGLDLVRAALVAGADGRLRAELTMSAAWTAAELRGSGGGAPAQICVRIYTKRDPTADIADYLVCAAPLASSDGYRGRVLRERRNGPPRKVASAAVSRPTSRTVYLRFRPKTIGNPAVVRFAAEVTVPSPQCSPSLGCRDSLPDAPKTVRLRLLSSSQSR